MLKYMLQFFLLTKGLCCSQTTNVGGRTIRRGVGRAVWGAVLQLRHAMAASCVSSLSFTRFSACVCAHGYRRGTTTTSWGRTSALDVSCIHTAGNQSRLVQQRQKHSSTSSKGSCSMLTKGLLWSWRECWHRPVGPAPIKSEHTLSCARSLRGWDSRLLHQHVAFASARKAVCMSSVIPDPVCCCLCRCCHCLLPADKILSKFGEGVYSCNSSACLRAPDVQVTALQQCQ